MKYFSRSDKRNNLVCATSSDQDPNVVKGTSQSIPKVDWLKIYQIAMAKKLVCIVWYYLP